MTCTVIIMLYEVTLEKCISVGILQVQYNLLTKINDFL